MLGDDLGDLLGTRIPGDHSRQVAADHYAARLRPTNVMDLGCGAGDSVELFRALGPGRALGGRGHRGVPRGGRANPRRRRVRDLRRRAPALRRRKLRAGLLQAGAGARGATSRAAEERSRECFQPGGFLAGSTSQLEAFHSRSIFNWTPYGFTVVAEEAGLEVVELRPVIDGFTLVAWRALGLPPFFFQVVGARVARLPRDRARRSCRQARRPHAQPDQARPLRAVRLPCTSAVASTGCAGSALNWRRPLPVIATPAAAARPREPLWGVIAVANGSYSVDYGQDRPSPSSGVNSPGAGTWSWRMKALPTGD